MAFPSWPAFKASKLKGLKTARSRGNRVEGRSGLRAVRIKGCKAQVLKKRCSASFWGSRV